MNGDGVSEYRNWSALSRIAVAGENAVTSADVGACICGPGSLTAAVGKIRLTDATAAPLAADARSFDTGGGPDGVITSTGATTGALGSRRSAATVRVRRAAASASVSRLTIGSHLKPAPNGLIGTALVWVESTIDLARVFRPSSSAPESTTPAR